MKNKKTIIITGGGTLGHILPIIPIVYEIYNEYNLYFITSDKGMEKSYFMNNDLVKYFKKIYYINMDGLNRKNIIKNIKTLYKYFKNKIVINKIINNIKPNLIIGMGGYISGIVIKQGIMKNIKTIIYEQNKVLGLGNKLVYKKVNKLLLNFDIESIRTKNKVIVSNPRITYVNNNYKTKSNNYILIISGSLGSEFINNLILKNLNYFNFKNHKIIIVVGKKYYKENNKMIKEIVNTNENIIIYDFCNNLVELMSEASIIISRSGSSTISEIIGLRKLSILIPSPNVTSNHQYLNALELYSKECCYMLEEQELTKEKLFDLINQIITNYAYNKKIVSNINKYFNNNTISDFIKQIKSVI